MHPTPARTVYLRAAGTALVVELTEPVPRVLHWGADLGALNTTDLAALALTAEPAVVNNALDVPRRLSVWPTEAEGWSGTPALSGHRAGTATTARLHTRDTHLHHHVDGTQELTLHLDDTEAGLHIRLRYRLTPSGVLAVDTRLDAPPSDSDDADRGAGDGGAPYDLAALTALLPVPARATEILDFTGKWSRERSPQRRPLNHGTHSREVRRGKPGVGSPYLLALGTAGFGFRHGEVWAVHLAWSGDQRYLAERHPEGAGVYAAVLGAGELLRPGEIRLAPGDHYQAPTCFYAWSDEGLDGLAHRFHTLLRDRPQHPRSPRPLLLNSWEAVYFQHDLDHLKQLADRAAKAGVERFVLDDGWFTGRRDDTAGLGDWTPDPQVWPDGLAPLADHVHALGLQFGLWVEPEMINLDSELARRHPDWILSPTVGLGATARHQYPLDLTHPNAWQHLHDRIDELVTRHRIDFLKWDHNRELHDAVHRDPHGDRPAVHAQTHALYRLLDALRDRHPGLEIESCASGGGRVDLGILQRTDRVWASDCNDPVERQTIQYWTGQLLPGELVGAHIGPAPAHTTGRTTTDSFRLATALFAHAGIEMDLSTCTEDELDRIAAWTKLYRELRPLLHTGRLVRADLPDDATLLHGIVAQDTTAALYAWVRLATSPDCQSGRVPLPGLDPDAHYRIRIRSELGLPRFHQIHAPAWLDPALADGTVLPGTVLTRTGLPMPTLAPEQALLIEAHQQP